MPEVDAAQGVYGISTAAELAEVDPQSLRLYERHGLIRPARTQGGTRRYSADDLERVQRVRELLDAGVNLTGIRMVLGLESDNARLRDELGPSRAAARSRAQQPGSGRR